MSGDPKKGVIIDATILPSSNRPLSKARREELDQIPSLQIDTQASSTAKRGRYYVGYKGHIGVDLGNKLIRKKGFTTASPHDSQVKEELFSGDEQAVFANSAYSHQQDKRACRAWGIYYGVHDKGTRKKPLSKSQKRRNRKKSSVRSAVEHPFGYMKERLGYAGCVARNLLRNELRSTMNCVVYNLMREHWLLARKI